MSTLQTSKPEKNTPRHVRVKLSITETDFVVLEDTTSLDSNAVVLKVMKGFAYIVSRCCCCCCCFLLLFFVVVVVVVVGWTSMAISFKFKSSLFFLSQFL